MSDRIIYVLCYDDKTEEKARYEFLRFPWARIYRIPNESQNHLFEGVMYQTELMKLYDEWKDKKFVGTISYKLLDRLNFYKYTTIDKISEKIKYTNPIDFEVVPFMYYAGANFDDLTPDVKNTYIYLADKSIPIEKQYTLFNSKRLYTRSYEVENLPFFYFNYWMTTPNIMLEFIEFFNRIWLPNLENTPCVWNDSSYKGHLSEDDCQKLTKKVSYYPYHSFINERLPASYFRYKKYRINYDK